MLVGSFSSCFALEEWIGWERFSRRAGGNYELPER